MSDQFIAEIRIFAGNFAPRGWASCDGQIMPINQNTALFSLLGTNFGGDGRSTFALPNLNGRAPMGFGQGPGLTSRVIGEAGGSANVALTTAQLAAHGHGLRVADSTAPGAQTQPTANTIPTNAAIYSNGPAAVPMANVAVAAAGAAPAAAHDNMQPYLAMNFIIALQGIFPSRA